MSIKSTVLNALMPVLNNVWAVELPVEPTFPAIVFEIESLPEGGWVAGAGYTRHTVVITVLSADLDEVEALRKECALAMAGIPEFLYADEHGDAAYEDDASLYGYFGNYVVRTKN